MRKAITTNSFGRGWLIAASLVFTLAAFGCSSNQMYGNGQPSTVTPTMNSSDHAVTPGSSSGTNGNPPMASSYTYGPALSSDMYPTNQVDVNALAIAAADRGYRGIVLGPSGAEGYQPGVTVAGGVYVSPALSVNPAQTINSSISSSGGGQAITNGPIVPAAQGGVSLASNAATTLATTGTTAATLGTAATGALTTSAGTPVLGGSAVFSPVLMNSTPAPQATGSANQTLATIGASGTGTTIVSGSLLPGVTTSNGTTATRATAATSTSRTTASTTANIVNGIQIQTGATGNVMVTNVGASPAAAHH